MQRPRARTGKSSSRSSRNNTLGPIAPSAREVKLGVVTKAHGLRGELCIDSDPSTHDRTQRDARLLLVIGEHSQEFRVSAVRATRAGLLMKLDGVDDRSAAEAWVRADVFSDREALVRDAASYYDFELVGLEVFTDAGVRLGTISEVVATGANDVLVVAGDHGEILIPAIASALLEVDTVARRVRVDERTIVRQDDEELTP